MKIEPDHMAAAAEQASELLRSLGNRHRLLILCQLTEGERSVGDLAAFLGLRDSTVSQHLSLLRRDGLVQRAARRPDDLVFARQLRRRGACWKRCSRSSASPPPCASRLRAGRRPRHRPALRAGSHDEHRIHRTLGRAAAPRIDPDQCGPASPGMRFAPWKRDAALDRSSIRAPARWLTVGPMPC